MQNSFSLTPEGNETTFAANHLGHFVLTTRLLPKLRAAAAGKAPGSVRIVNVSSVGHEFCRGMKWNDLNLTEKYHPGSAYCQAKLANILFTRALAKRLANDGIVAHAMHPGAVDSNFVSHADARTQQQMKALDLITPAQAADTLVWLATAEEPGRSNGGYFHERQEIPSSAAAQDAGAAERLWTESGAIVARAGV
jgi:NAD(P)-dependent dehydrogenase (short-subunit alcohol dehydrogenase family)